MAQPRIPKIFAGHRVKVKRLTRKDAEETLGEASTDTKEQRIFPSRVPSTLLSTHLHEDLEMILYSMGISETFNHDVLDSLADNWAGWMVDNPEWMKYYRELAEKAKVQFEEKFK